MGIFLRSFFSSPATTRLFIRDATSPQLPGRSAQPETNESLRHPFRGNEAVAGLFQQKLAK